MNSKLNDISVTDAIKYGWEKFKVQPKLWLGISALVLSPNIVGALIDATTEAETITLVAGLITVMTSILSTLFGLGLLKAGLDATDKNEKVEFSDIWSVMDRRLISVAGAYLLTFAIILLPLVLILGSIFGVIFFNMPVIVAVIIGAIGAIVMIVIAIRLYFVQYGIIDQSMTATEAIKHSFTIVKGHELIMIWFGILIGVINLLTIFTLFIGLLVTVPVTAIASAYMYRLLSDQEVALFDSSDEARSDSEKSSEGGLEIGSESHSN
jgi:uncharacterized membrane protein